jgi:hypothetical protein
MSNKKNDTDRPAAEMPLSFGDEAPSDWLGKNIVFRVGKGGEGYIRDKSTGEWKSVDAVSDDLIKELRSYPRHYEAAHRAAEEIERLRAEGRAADHAEATGEGLLSMSDLVYKLRNLGSDLPWEVLNIGWDASDEIQRLRADNARLIEKLRNIATENIPRERNCEHGRYYWQECPGCLRDYARAALAEEEK